MRLPMPEPCEKGEQLELKLDNIETGETVYQRCLLLVGHFENSPPNFGRPSENFLRVETHSDSGVSLFPTQSYPIACGHFKAIVFLSPGSNVLTLSLGSAAANSPSFTVPNLLLRLNYVPPLQTPPLHLAIMVAKDSPLLIDCPPSKAGGLSTAHGDLEAAIAKFRMAAYMWQALTAEDMRLKGLGRRSFRFDEEWAVDTVARDFINVATSGSLAREGGASSAMRSTAKIHVVRSDKTTKELRDPNVAQQNPQAHDANALHQYFTSALQKRGGPFAPEACPIVAGLILDSHYSVERDLVLAHAALGSHNARGISLGMMGSHLTYSWPRFLEEVAGCLTDGRAPGCNVGNDNGECTSMWEACSVGQGAFLHEVGHAFGFPHRAGIMERGYPVHWPRNFLPFTAYCTSRKSPGLSVVTGETENTACWNLIDALSFAQQAHFRLPDDPFVSRENRDALPSVEVNLEDQEATTLTVTCGSLGIARIQFQEVDEPGLTAADPANQLKISVAELEQRFDRAEKLKMHILGMNGKEKTVSNVWKLLSNSTFIPIPGTNTIITKHGVTCEQFESEDMKKWEWAVLLKDKNAKGEIVYANAIDCRVGLVLDGATVTYTDDTIVPCGPRWNESGRDHHFGGHASESRNIDQNTQITKVEVTSGNWGLAGLRMHASDGSSWGELNDVTNVTALEPNPGQQIIGFYGCSEFGSGFQGILEFGILTLPVDVGDEVMEACYGMAELKNTDGNTGPRPKSNKRRREYDESDDESHESDEADQSDEEME